ncbi:MAG: transcriptional repressor [Sphaerochaetaceae bacterium]|jgi:Fe2+ or Zn2+ uptake regulation protein|nr:transcriptional repressor [Sphaerochaetaceae bacterium]
MTKQQTVVLDFMRTQFIHPTAETVWEGVKDKLPGISLATVYRNLHRLCDDGLVRQISMPDGSNRFDGNLSGHWHMQCLSCREVYDLPAQALKAPDGFQVYGDDVVLKCLCSKCKAKV